MTEFGKGPLLDVKTLGEMGYRMVLFPLTAFRVAMRAAEETLRDLMQNGTQKASVPKMMTRAELYDLLGYTGYEERDKAYFGNGRCKCRMAHFNKRPVTIQPKDE